MSELISEKVLLRIENYPIDSTPTSPISITAGEWIYIDTNFAQVIFDLIRGTSNQDVIDHDFRIIVPPDLDNHSKIRKNFVTLNPSSYYPEGSCVKDIIAAYNEIYSDTGFNAQSLISQLASYNIKATDLTSELSISDQITFELLKLMASDIRMILVNRSLDLLQNDRRDEMLAILYNKTLLEGLSVIMSTNNNSIKNKYLGRTI